MDLLWYVFICNFKSRLFLPILRCKLILMVYILQIVAEKQRFKKNPHNYAVKKTILMKQKVIYNISAVS